MADLQLPHVYNGAPLDADAWYNPVAEAVQSHEDSFTSPAAAHLPGTLIAYGRRISDKTFTGTEVGVLRLDSVSLRNGYRYWVMTSSLRITAVSGETGKASVRYSTAGAAGTGDTILTSVEANPNTSFTPVQTPTIVTTYAPGANVTFSVLLTLTRSGGSGNVTMTGSATQPIELYIVVAGPDPGDTGVDI